MTDTGTDRKEHHTMPVLVIVAKVAAIVYVLAIVSTIPYLSTSDAPLAARARRALRMP